MVFPWYSHGIPMVLPYLSRRARRRTGCAWPRQCTTAAWYKMKQWPPVRCIGFQSGSFRSRHRRVFRRSFSIKLGGWNPTSNVSNVGLLWGNHHVNSSQLYYVTSKRFYRNTRTFDTETCVEPPQARVSGGYHVHSQPMFKSSQATRAFQYPPLLNATMSNV